MIDQFQSRIERFSRARRRILNVERACRLGVRAALAGIAGLLVLGGWVPGAFVNLVLFLALFAFWGWLLAGGIRRRVRFRSHMDEAFRMEAIAGGLNSRLISALDFLSHPVQSPLMRYTIDRAREDLPRDFESRLDRAGLGRERKRLAVVLVVFLALGLTPWVGFARSARNLVRTVAGVREALFPVRYEITPAPGRYVRRLGTEVPVRIRFRGRGYREVAALTTVGKKTDRSVLPVGTGGAGVTLTSTTESEQSVRFEFGQRRSAPVQVVFADDPVLENMQSELVYPAYTRMLPKGLEGVQTRFYCLAGTRITLGFTFSKDLAGAALNWDDGTSLPLEVVGRFAHTTLIHSQTRRAALQVEDVHGFHLREPVAIDFELQIDEKPQVFLPGTLKAEMPTMADGLKLFGFGARLKDDFGLSRCVLKWTRSTVSDPGAVTARGEVEQLISPPRRQALVTFNKPFEHLAVQPGDRISFQVIAYDNHWPESQMTASPTRSLFVYQQELDDLRISQLGFGSGDVARARIGRSRRDTSVKLPDGERFAEKFVSTWKADVETATRPPVVPGDYSRHVKDYFRLMSTAVRAEGAEQQPAPAPGTEPAAPEE